jgi:hypothetical protein
VHFNQHSDWHFRNGDCCGPAVVGFQRGRETVMLVHDLMTLLLAYTNGKIGRKRFRQLFIRNFLCAHLNTSDDSLASRIEAVWVRRELGIRRAKEESKRELSLLCPVSGRISMTADDESGVSAVKGEG